MLDSLKEYLTKTNEYILEHDDRIDGRLGQRLESFGKDEYVCSYPVEPWMANPSGFLHGGITTAMFDQAMGLLSIYSADGRPTPTIDIRVSYCRPIPVGTRLYIRSRMMVTGRTMVQTQAEAWVEDRPEAVAAYASAAYHIIKKDHFLSEPER